MFRVADAVSTVDQCQVAHLVEVAGAVFIFQSHRIKSEERVLSPEKRSGFGALIAEVQLDSFHFMRRNDGSVLCPTVMIDSRRYSVCRRSGGKNIHNHTFVVAVYREIHFPAIRRTPMPVKNVLPALPIPVPVDIPPNLVDTLGECFLFLVSVDVILVYGQQTLDEESGLYQIAPIIFLTEWFHLARITIPPMRVGSMETVCLFEERNDAFHSCQSLFAGDVTAVDSGKDSHDAEAAAAGSDYIGIVFWINAVHMITFGS